MTFDVAVVGAGPAGSAAAATLARRGRRVALFERSRFGDPRIGETLGGEVAPLLAQLGASEALAATNGLPFRAVRSAWGGPELAERSSIAHPLGDGAHVDRARFDAALAAAAAGAGAIVRTGTGACATERTEGGFRVRPARGDTADAKFLIDASGRGAPASAGLVPGRRWVACDRMVALVSRVPDPPSSDRDLLIEAAEVGWWYSAPQPSGELVVALMTDSDLVPPVRVERERWYRGALERTAHTSGRTGPARLDGDVRVVRADSGWLLPDRTNGFAAAGDAAMAFDPLAGNGVARALRSGIETAEAVDRALSGEPLAPSDISERFASALDRRARYYAVEGRWPDSPFWARRRPPDWTAEPVTLSPETLLVWRGAAPSPRDLAPVEAILPRRAIESALELARGAMPAHAVLAALRDFAPLGDRRLLVGLQLLVEKAPLETVGA